ncbi:MAG: GNAT family N-acetyltransferase [Solirubrobacterales bacterium]
MISAVTELDGLAEFESDWRRLAERRGNAFLTPEWARCWFEHYGEGASPFVPVLQGGNGTLKGLLPLALPDSGHPRVCRIAGANLGDHFHPLAERGQEAEVAAAVGEALASSPSPWSILALDHVELEEPWLASLSAGTGLRLRLLERTSAPLPFIELSRHASWDDYLASRSSNLRQQVRRFARRAAKRHSMRLRRTDDPGELRADMAVFFGLHDRRFSAESSLRSERARAFHTDFSAAALKRGWLRLWFLELDGAPVAAWYGWRVGARYAFFNSGFDPDWSETRPGLVLQSAVIESALEEGAEEFDFLLGDERYKFRFAEESRTVSDVILARALPHPAALVASAEHFARRLGRLMPESARRRLARRSLLRGRRR